jgi:hypothetical protein
MNGIAGHLTRAAVFVAIGVAVSLAVVLPQRASATADPVISYVQRGLISAVNCYPWYEFADAHYCWHDDEPGDFKAIDYTVAGGPTPGASVYFHYRGDSQLFKIVAIPYPTDCTGVAAALYWKYVGNESYRRGTINYLHIDPAAGVVGTIPDSFEWLGSVSSDQPGCYWTGPHLHQSAGSSGNHPFYFNRWENPWRDYYHEHTIYWPALQSDADGDSYGDNLELRLSTDPQDACADTITANNERGFDYYEPISPWPPDFDDNRTINIIDTFQVLPPIFGSVSGDPNYYARSDLVPDGVINIADVFKVMPPVYGSSCTL